MFFICNVKKSRTAEKATPASNPIDMMYVVVPNPPSSISIVDNQVEGNAYIKPAHVVHSLDCWHTSCAV